MTDTHQRPAEQPAPPDRLIIEATRGNAFAGRCELREGSLVRVGSAEHADLRLEGLPRVQATIAMDQGVVRVVNLGQVGSVRLGRGLRVNEPVVWLPGMPVVVQIGADIDGPAETYRLTRTAFVDDGPTEGAATTAEVSDEAGKNPPPALELELVPRLFVLEPGTPKQITVRIVNGTQHRLAGRLTIAPDGELARVLMVQGIHRPLIERPILLDPGRTSLEQFELSVPKEPSSIAGKYKVAVTVTAQAGAQGANGEVQHPLTGLQDVTWQIAPYSASPVLATDGRWRRKERRVWDQLLSLENPTNRSVYYRIDVTSDRPSPIGAGPGQPGQSPIACLPESLIIPPGERRPVVVRVTLGPGENELIPGETIRVTARAAQGDEQDSRTLTFERIWSPFASLDDPHRRRIAGYGLVVALATLALLIGLFAMQDRRTAESQAQTAQAAAAARVAAITGAAQARQDAAVTLQVAVSTQQAAAAQTIQSQAAAVVTATQGAQALALAVQGTAAAELQPVRDRANALATAEGERALQATVAAQVASQEVLLFQTADAGRATVEAQVGGTATQVANAAATADAGSTVLAQAATQQALVDATATAGAEPARVTIGGEKLCVGKDEPLGNVVITVFDRLGREAVGITETVRVELQAVDRGKGRLSGTLERPLDRGIARFTDLSINETGYYRLLARFRRFQPQPSEIIQVVGEGAPDNKCVVRAGGGGLGEAAGPALQAPSMGQLVPPGPTTPPPAPTPTSTTERRP